tara:strand:- start:1966 stop:2739 length:774 start_codon:yes stop_codon:yes gene_type:complete
MSKNFEVVVLGSGTSQGVPVITCDCSVCNSTDLKDTRLRSSILIKYNGIHIVVDTGPDFREQMLRNNVKTLDAVVFTHEHKDHLAGMDDIRPFNYRSGKDMEVYASEAVQEALKREYSYIFADLKYPGIPKVQLNTIETTPFKVHGIEFVPIDVLHYQMPVKGFRIDNFAYVTDANYIAEGEKEKLHNLDVLILNCLRKEKHISHFNLEEAIELVNELKPKMTYFTHISHYMGKHEEVAQILPSNIQLSYDGLTIKL